MSNPSEETGITKRSRLFKGKVVQHRSNLKKRGRHSQNPNHPHHQSTGDITQSCARMDQNGSTTGAKDDAGNTGRKMPRWLRLLKLTSISATTNITLDGLKTDNTSYHRQGNLNTQQHQQQQQQPQEEIHSFLGNLGIGAYVGEEENAFVNSDTSEDIQMPTNKSSSSKPISKSMINLSSISLWPPKRRTSDQTNDTEALSKEIVEQYTNCSSPSSSSRVSCTSQTSSSSPQPQSQSQSQPIPLSALQHPQSTSPFSTPADKMSMSKGTTTTRTATTRTAAAAISQNLDQFRQSEFYESMPLILKTVIHQTSMLNINTNMKQNYFKGFMCNNLTPKPSTNTITRTNSSINNNESGENSTHRKTIHYPAWMIITDEQLQLDTTYSFYRIPDYLKELYIADAWLDNLLISDILHSRCHSPVRKPADFRSRRTRAECSSLSSNKTSKRTCSEQRYEETQLIAGLWDRKEMDIIQKSIRGAISIIELKMSSKYRCMGESFSDMSAVIFRNSSNEMSIPISLRSFVPETEKAIVNNKEINVWKKIYAEEVVNIVKLPRFPVEQTISLETIHQSQKSTIFLYSDHLVLTQWPLDPEAFLSTGDLAHIIPLHEVWCDALSSEGLFSRLSTYASKSTGNYKSNHHHHHHHSQKHLKASEIDMENMKCNASSSSGISTASLEDGGGGGGGGGDLNSPPIDNNNNNSQSVDPDIIKLTNAQSSSLNDNNVLVDTSLLLIVGRPLTENWAIRFANNSLCEKWEQMINESIRRNQEIFHGKTVSVKVVNQVIPNHQVIYKYYNVPIHMTADQLKEKALESLNINVGNTTAELFLRYTESNGEDREILMYGPERPFLIAFSSVQMNSASSPSHHQNSNGSNNNSYSVHNSSSCSVNSPDTNNYSPQNKDIFEIIKKMSPSPQSDIRANDNDCIIPRDQIKVNFVLRSMEKSLNEENSHSAVKSEDPMKPVEYTKQERGRSKSRAHGRRVGGGGVGAGAGAAGGDSRNNNNTNIMTKSSIFFDNSTSSAKQASLPLRAAISTSSLQSGITQDVQCGQIFGCLPEQVWPDSQLPESLVNLFAIVYYNGVDIEGIFRRTAVHSQIELMRARVDENIQTITPNNCNAILASCVLKRFFCEIPGHLLIDAKWDEWASLTEINSPSERLQLIEKLVRSLPKVNQTLLALLIYLLAHIRDNEEANRMSARNLAVVWGPNLIQRPNTPLALDDSKIATQIVTYLLEPPVTNFLLETSNAKNELNQHFKNIWGNLKGTSTTSKTMESSKLHNMSTSMTAATATTTDSSEEEKSSRLDSGVHSEQKTEDSRHTLLKSDVKIKYPSRRGHSVSNIPPQINPLESDSVFSNEKHYSSLLKTNEQHDETPVNASPTISSTGNSSHSSSTVMNRRGVGRMNRKKHSLLSHMTLPDQTGPPTAVKQTVGNPDTTTTTTNNNSTPIESKNLTRLRATSTIVQPLSSSLALTPTKIMLATATATATASVTTTSEAIGTPRRTSDVRRSRNTSCPPNRNSTLLKLSTPYPLPKTQVELEAPPIPPRLQPACTGQNNPSVKCKKNTSIATNTPSAYFNHSNQQTKMNTSQCEEKTPSPPIPKRTFHRRTRPQKTTSEIPDITLLKNAYYAKDSRSMNNGSK
ncbi:unnamed protein product [Trichobilharzia szidati]|nr:unnamed protein product [Trichobilharzia szidati]